MEVSQSLIKEDFNSYLNKPPFFTIQPHIPTREKQLGIWANLAIQYFQKNKITESTVAELNNDSHELFSNKLIKRKLPLDGIMLLLEHLAKLGMIEWKSPDKQSFTIFYYNPMEIAELMYKWAKNNAKIGKIESLQWISEGEDTEPTDKLYGLSIDVLLKGARILESQNKAQVIQTDEREYGVKFLA